MGYPTAPEKYWNYTKINTWEDHEVWTFGGKCYIIFGPDGYTFDREAGNNYNISMTIFSYNPKLSL